MPRTSATDRLGRILSMIPWIASQDRPRIDEVCERFDITRAELAADLDVVFVVGLYPYTPDALIDIELDEEHVSIAYTNFFERPLRLSREEGLALLASGVVAARQPGHDPDGPLARGVAKVARVLGIDLDDDLGVVVDPATAATQRLLDRAIAERKVVHLSYFSHGRNEQTERDVEPQRLFGTDGSWYLDAHCRVSDDHRVFRLDRIVGAHETDETFTPRSEAGPGSAEAFAADPNRPRVTIEVDGADRWLVDQYPTEDVVELDSGRLRVTLAVTATPWLERLLLRLGPPAIVVDGPPELRSAGREAAARILTRYQSTP